MEHLLEGDVEGAGAVIAAYEAGQIFPRGMGIDWSDGVCSSSLVTARYLLDAHYPDMAYDDSTRKRVAAALALANLLGEGVDAGARRVIAAAGGSFESEVISNHIRHHAGQGLVADYAGRSDGVAAMFAQYWLGRAYLEHTRDQLLKLGQTVRLGLRILPAPGDPCPGSRLIFGPDEVDQLPVLPHTDGCRCALVSDIAGQ